ncbi:hypothetical protein [Rhizobium sp. PAMB 3182]
MADESDRNSGLQEAHTLAENSGAAAIEPDPERAAKVGATRAMTEAAMKDLGEQLAGGDDEAEQPSLLLDEADEQLALFAGPVRHVAETINAARAGRGRPKGSKNKANAEFRDTLMRMGYRHPGLNLAALANADPAGLAMELGALPPPPDNRPAHEWLQAMVLAGAIKRDVVTGLMFKAQELIKSANAELLPYFESKAPTKSELAVDAPQGVMIIGEMNVHVARDEKTIDLTRFDRPAEKSE